MIDISDEGGFELGALGKLRAKDAADLRFLLSYERPSGFGKSSTAACIEQLETYGQHAVPCRRCGGDPERDVGGSGCIASRRQRRGRAVEQVERDDLPPALGDRVCPSCEGRGWALSPHRNNANGALTARPRSQRKALAATDPHTPDYGDLGRLLRTSRRLEAVRRRAPIAARILEEYYGRDGGRLEALWIFTHAGQAMLAENPFDLSPEGLFANEREAQRVSPREERQALFDQANESARRLLKLARAFWNMADVALPSLGPLASKPIRPAA